MELLYFTDISQVQYVFEHKQHLFEIMRPITGDIVVASELERLCIPFIDEWDFLNPVDIASNSETANLIANNWWNKSLETMEYEGFSLSSCTVQDMVYPFEACLNAKIVYETIFQKYSIDKISGYFLPSIGVVRTGPIPTHLAVRSISQAVLFWLADKHDINIEKFESEYPLSQTTISRKRSVFNSIETIKSKKLDQKIKRTALIIYDTMAGSEHENIKASFKKLDEWQTVSIAKSDLKNYTFLNKKNSSLKKQFKYSPKAFIKDTLTYKGLYPEIFANPYLDFQFKCIWNEMELAIEYGSLFSTFLDILKPSIILLGHDAFTIERVFVRLAQKRLIPTISLLHGGLGHKFGYKGIVGEANSILVWNDIDIACLKLCGENESRLYKIGCVKYEDKFKRYIKGISSGETEVKNKAREKIKIAVDKPVILLLTAAINSGFAAPISNPRKHRETLDALLKLILIRKDLTFIIKAHPSYDYYEIYRRMNDLNLPNLIFLESLALDDVLEASDVCLLINYFTTASLEAMLHHVPVIYLNNAVYPIHSWEENVSNFKINKIHSVLELENKIDMVLTDSNLRKKTFSESDNIIRQIMDIKDISPTDRLISFIENVNVQQKDNNKLIKLIYQICTNTSLNNITEQEIGIFLNEIILNHSIENVLHTLSFIAGSNNTGISSISSIFEVFNRHFGKEKLPNSQLSWWTSLQFYILGYNSNSLNSDRHSAIQLVGRILLHLRMFIAMPIQIKRQIFRYITNGIIGSNEIVITVMNKIINTIRQNH